MTGPTGSMLLVNAHLELSAEQRESWSTAWPGLRVVNSDAASAERLDGRGITFLVTQSVPEDLTMWPDLRWVQLLSAGADQVLGHPVLNTEIPVTTASGIHSVPIAQFVTGTWLAMAHRLPDLMGFKQSRVWPDRVALSAFTVRGLTVGILGYGAIGRECARQLSGLGMRVLCAKNDPLRRRDTHYNAWPGTGDPEGELPEEWFGPDQLDSMLPQCDLLVVTAPSTPSTVGMLGERELKLLKQGARVIVVSRGGIVDEAALAAALRSGRIAEAVVDCYTVEPPPPSHPFFDLANLVMTPHMSGVYDGSRSAMAALIGENLRRLRAGEPLLNRVGAGGY